MKIGTVTFPGPNGTEAIEQLCKALGHELLYFNPKDTSFKEAEAVILPGAYSYGDAIRPAALAKTNQICGAIGRFAESGKPLLGLGHGFQLLCEIGVLPGVLLRNRSREFTSCVTGVRVENGESPLGRKLKQGTILKLPVACYYGQFAVDSRKLKLIEKSGQVGLRYVDRFGDHDVGAPFLGSANNIAGIYNEQRNVLGTMAHPERALGTAENPGDGMLFFKAWFDGLA
jgi:phosphoribosylformylglycinamidine synthase